MRAVGLDVHLDFCEVAIVEDGEVRSAGRIETKPEQIELFASSLGPDDRVALEVTGNAWEIARQVRARSRSWCGFTRPLPVRCYPICYPQAWTDSAQKS